MPLVELPDPLPAERELGAVHLVGVAGAGMSALARLLAARGHVVTGCDAHEGEQLDALRQAGIPCVVGHDAAHVSGPRRPWPVDTLVVSTAVRPEHPERVAARRAGLPVLPRAVALAALAAGQRAVAVTGTHGKTTTTAMCVVALQAVGLDPSYALGGQLAGPTDTGNAHLGGGDVFVLEADESDGSFLAYRPYGAVVTNVDADHLDAYGTVAAYRRAFGRFIDTIRPGGFLVACADDPGAAGLAGRATRRGLRVITYGEHPTAQVRLDPADASPPRTAGAGPGRASTTDPARPGARPPAVPGHAAAQVTVAGHAPLRLQLAVPGRHNLLDAAAALAVGTALGAPVEGLVAGLARFPGTHRRLEPRGQARGVVLLDSYAHHPTEVVADLRAARELVPAGGRLVVAFQPHLYSRTRTFARELGAALGLADVVVVTDVYPAREDPLPGVTGRLVADAVPLPHDRVRYVPAVADLPGRLAALARPGDLVLTLGAGDITTAAAPLLTALGGQAGAG